MSNGLDKTGHVQDPLTDPPTSRRTRAALSILALLVVVAFSLFYWWQTYGGATGDPGGRILAQLRAVQTGVPKSASVNDSEFDEPFRLDSCKGKPGTQGWNDVVANISFQWSGSRAFLVSYVAEHLRKMGWGHFTVQYGYGAPSWQWTMRLANGTTALAGLDHGYKSTWGLSADAPPVGKRASGC